MKKTAFFTIIVVVAIISFAFLSPLGDSKIGHIESEYLFKRIPAYEDAKEELEKIGEQYKSEVEAKYKTVDSLYKMYQKEEVLLPQETKIKRQNEIIEKENEAKKLQQKYFGQEGLMDQKREELLKPIQDNIYNAIKKIAVDGNFDYIFDKTTNEILYARDLNNQSDAVLKELGY